MFFIRSETNDTLQNFNKIRNQYGFSLENQIERIINELKYFVQLTVDSLYERKTEYPIDNQKQLKISSTSCLKYTICSMQLPLPFSTASNQVREVLHTFLSVFMRSSTTSLVLASS